MEPIAWALLWRRCTGCGATGATLGCRENKCKCNFHLPCAILARATFYPSKFVLACTKHAKRFRKEEESIPCVPSTLPCQGCKSNSDTNISCTHTGGTEPEIDLMPWARKKLPVL